MQLHRSAKPLMLILGTGLVGLPVVSQAQNNWYDNWYVGASVGQSFVDELGIDDDDTAFKVFGGYQFNKYLGAELGFVDHGELEDRGNELDVDGFSFAAVGTLPLNEQFSVHGKAGVYAWDLDTRGAIGARFSNDTRDTDPFYGLGVSYQFYKNWSAIGEWERYEIDDVDIDLVSIGFSYRF